VFLTKNETETQTTLRLMTAMDRQQPVTITYLKADGSETIRTIEIYDIQVSNAGDILLKVMDRQSQDRRTFRVDRIQAYTVHRSTYTVARPADLTPATPKAFCSSCSYLCEMDDLAPDHNGDPTCSDCLASWEGLTDTCGGFTFAYAA
jgi:predicted DNA-binding transcriptional regulator YafY